MIRIVIPRLHQKGFKHFLSLDIEQISKLSKALTNLRIGTTPQETAKIISDVLGINTNKSSEIAPMLFGLFSAYDTTKLNPKDFVNRVIEAIKDVEEFTDLEMDAKFKTHFVKLIQNSTNFNLTSKAVDLVTERENILTSTRIISDIRPVFSKEKKIKVEANVIIHNLKIEYRDDFEKKEIFLALDSNDLSNLKKQILRTEKKNKHLFEVYSSKDIPLIDLKN